MRLVVILLLCFIWIALAVRAFQHGNPMVGGIFIFIGVALTAYRLRKLAE